MMIERENTELSLSTQAELLGLSRSSLYYVPVPPSPEELHIKRRIDEIYTAHPFYGSRKILAVLRREMSINRKAVQRHMREMGLAAIHPGPNLSRRAQQHAIFPYLLRGLAITRLNQVWGIDITYIRLRGGWMPSPGQAGRGIWWLFWTGSPDMLSAGSSTRRWKCRSPSPGGWTGCCAQLSVR